MASDVNLALASTIYLGNQGYIGADRLTIMAKDSSLAFGTVGGCVAAAAGNDITGANTVPITVTKAPTTTLVVSDVASTQEFGKLITFSAGVSTPTAFFTQPQITGTVTFQSDGVNIPGCVNLATAPNSPPNALASCATATLAVGPHVITASYNGDANYQTSQGTHATNPYTITKAATAIDTIPDVNAI